MSGLNKEIWLNRLEANEWFADNPFMQHAVNLDAFVENDNINFAKQGSFTAGVEKNPTYPLATPAQRSDSANKIALDEYATNPIVVTDAEQVELAYQKLDSYVRQAQQHLEERIAGEALWNIGAIANTNATPIIDVAATNAVHPTDSRKIITQKDIAKLAELWDNLNYPQQGRVLVVNPNTFWAMVQNSTELMNQYIINDPKGVIDGVLLQVHGFEVLKRTGTPYYDDAALNATAKIAYGASPGVNDLPAAVAYIKNMSFGRALGTISMYERTNDPEWQGTIMSFRKRAAVKTFFQQYLGVIRRTA